MIQEGQNRLINESRTLAMGGVLGNFWYILGNPGWELILGVDGNS